MELLPRPIGGNSSKVIMFILLSRSEFLCLSASPNRGRPLINHPQCRTSPTRWFEASHIFGRIGSQDDGPSYRRSQHTYLHEYVQLTGWDRLPGAVVVASCLTLPSCLLRPVLEWSPSLGCQLLSYLPDEPLDTLLVVDELACHADIDH